MAENPPLMTSINTSPPSHHPNALLTHSLQTLDEVPPSIIDPILDNPQKSPLSSHQSPKKPIDSNESSNLYDVGEVSSDFGVGGIDGGENSGVLRDEIDVGFETNDEIDKIDELGSSRCNFHGSPLVDSKESLNLGEFSSDFDDNVDVGGENSRVLVDKIDVGFETNGENGGGGGDVATYSLTMELIDETVVLGNVGNGVTKGKMVISHGAGSIGNGVGTKGKMVISHDDVGKVEGGGTKGKMVISQDGAENVEDGGMKGKMVISYDGAENVENGGTKGKMVISHADVVDVGNGGMKGKMVISHGVENGGLKYTRKEMEKLRYVNVKSKKKFWQQVYNGLSDQVRKEYDDLGSFRKNKQVSGKNKKNNNFCQGVLGMAAARGRCDYSNIYVYERNWIVYC